MGKRGREEERIKDEGYWGETGNRSRNAIANEFEAILR